ncbi:MAG: MarR family transcriptional regulator [Acidobacteriales bacterium]|nr:MarR family transcriptional regulator [Terriglobales bacterium]
MNFSDQFLAACAAAKEAKMNCLTHVMVLAHLATKDEGDYPSRLAVLAKVSTAAITGVLDALEKLGLVERGRCQSDRRGNRAHITPKGLETIARMLP